MCRALINEYLWGTLQIKRLGLLRDRVMPSNKRFRGYPLTRPLLWIHDVIWFNCKKHFPSETHVCDISNTPLKALTSTQSDHTSLYETTRITACICLCFFVYLTSCLLSYVPCALILPLGILSSTDSYCNGARSRLDSATERSYMLNLHQLYIDRNCLTLGKLIGKGKLIRFFFMQT